MTTYPASTSWVRLQRIILGCICAVALVNQAIAQAIIVGCATTGTHRAECQRVSFIDTLECRIEQQTSHRSVRLNALLQTEGQSGGKICQLFETGQAAFRKGQLSQPLG